MSVTKRISGNYTLQTLNPTDRININSPTVVINGNLFVSGNSQTVSTIDSEITNNQIILNAGWTGTPVLNANIIVARGTSAIASIGWNEQLQIWQISNGVATSNILVGGGSSSGVVSSDTNPALSANLNLNGHTIWDSTSYAGTQLFIGNTIGAGGTGVLVTNSQYANVEVMSSTRSLAYSLIFG
jgi:hypothetical protein